jgi:hypothetical protein
MINDSSSITLRLVGVGKYLWPTASYIMSRESRVLSSYFKELCYAISDPIQVADELSSEGIIPVEFVQEMKQQDQAGTASFSTKRQQSAIKMLSVVDQAISRDASRLTTLIQVLKDCLNDNGRAAEAVRSMEVELYGRRGAGDGEYVSILQARTVIRKHMNNIASVITDIRRIAEDLYDNEIISHKQLDDIIMTIPHNGDRTLIEYTSRLLEYVEGRVERDPGRFPVVMAVLKDDPSTDQNVVALMEAEYSKAY